jgi:YidC/Oxa1 family membrane protein insertase
VEKNTIWAIVLSTIVVIASFLLQPIIFGPQIEAAMQQQEIAAQEQKELAEKENSVLIESEILQNDSEFVNAEIQENLKEEFVTITTDVVEVVFSNKGGDIISYKLLKHFDKDTGTGIQLADNVTETNRACALALGTADKEIINQIFEHEMIDENTILFKRNFIFEKNGKKEVVTLGKKYSFKPGEYIY